MTLKELAKLMENERFRLGIGVRDFADHVGISYHTYYSFLRQDRKTQSKTVSAVIRFLETQDIKIDVLELE